MTSLAVLPSNLGPVRILRPNNMPGVFALTCPACSHTYALRPPRHLASFDQKGRISISSPISCPTFRCGWYALILKGQVVESVGEEAGRLPASRSSVPIRVTVVSNPVSVRKRTSRAKDSSQGKVLHARFLLARVR